MQHTYHHAILGGTFDHFHAGHAKFIATAFGHANHVTIGLVKEPFETGKTHSASIEPYPLRENNLSKYLNKIQVSARSTTIPLSDIYGTSLTDPSIEAIFVTESTQGGAKRINEERTKRGLRELAIEVIPLVVGDDGLAISSGRIRSGIIDRSGHSYLKFFLQKSSYSLPPNLRQTLQNPLGTTITNLKDLASIITPSDLLVSVGDIVSIDLAKHNYHPGVCLIDHRTRRRDLNQAGITKYLPSPTHSLLNPPGTINPAIGNILLSALTTYQKTATTQVIVVEGEEDLLALPALLLAPLNSCVIYGQYNVGMCIVRVTEDIKLFAKSLLTEFA